jgi:hypothetical protein
VNIRLLQNVEPYICVMLFYNQETFLVTAPSKAPMALDRSNTVRISLKGCIYVHVSVLCCPVFLAMD